MLEKVDNSSVFKGIVCIQMSDTLTVFRPTKRRYRVETGVHWLMPALCDFPTNDERHHVIVVGAGIGGLSSAALLASRGYKVLVVESHDRVGGNCTSWTRTIKVDGDKKTFVFDAGVQDISGLGSQGPLRNLLNQLDATDRITWNRVLHSYWKDGLCVNGAVSVDEFIDNVCQYFKDEAASIRAFFTEMEAVYREMYADIGDTGGIPMFPTGSRLLSWPEEHPHAFRWMRVSFRSMLNSFFKGEAIKNFLCTLSEYITDTPEALLVEDMAPLFGYYFDGGYYPSGGAQCFADFLAKIVVEKAGGILLKTRVRKILVDKGRVMGVVTADNRNHFAPLVIGNGDVVSMLAELVGEEHLPTDYAKKIETMGRGPSAILVSLGLSTIMPLPARLFVRQNGLEFGIGNPSVIDPSLAPAGYSSVTILCLLSEPDAKRWSYSGGAYRQRKEAFAESLISAVEDSIFPDIRKHIVYKQIASPATFTAFTGAKNGNIYGAARDVRRPSMQSPITGLLLVGAGTETGAGIEAAVVSGTRAANLISDAQVVQE